MTQPITQARPYAQAFFDLAQEQSALLEWQEQLGDLAALMNTPQLYAYVGNPKVAPDAAAQLLQELLPRPLSATLQRAVKLLAQERRLRWLPTIAQLFKEAVYVDLGIEPVVINTATELTEAQKSALETALKQRLQKEITTSYHLQPELLGGAVIRTNQWVIDSSVQGTLDQLKKTLVG